MTPGTQAEKVHFANQLRGIAALMVVVTHLLGVYFSQDIVARALGTEPLTLVRPQWTTWFFSQYYNLGPLGVAIFFLISGFVIPFSLGRLRGWPFLLSRAMRIYPTYWACLALGVVAILLSAGPRGVENGLAWPRLLGNALLVFPHFDHQASLDWVNWTLAVELKFYLLAALLGAGLSEKSFRPMGLVCLGMLAFIAVFSVLGESQRAPSVTAFFRGFAADMPYLIFMLVGTLFYKHHRGLLDGRQLAAQALFLLGVFVMAWSLAPIKAQFPLVTKNYFYGLLLFGVAYSLRRHCVPWPPLELMAAISYPLYAVHNLMGYALLHHLIRSGWTYSQALPLVLSLLFGLAYGLHRLIERPTQLAGKRWATAIARGPAEGVS
jgi:peptidoglycan/LPS O-acetylase OafA/YrhL